MRIIGIDPGYAIIGFGVVDYDGYNFRPVEYGAITTTSDMNFNDRLNEIYNDLSFVIKKHSPEHMAIEQLYFNTNQKTGIDVAQARGVILLCGIRNNVEIFEYTPLQVKQSVVGYGRAEKKQVMQMTTKILGLPAVPKPDDTADALAIAICHGHSYKSSKIFTIKE